MGMFAMRKPRGFNHSYIYVDERKEKLARMRTGDVWYARWDKAALHLIPVRLILRFQAKKEP